jgi:putative transposase
MYIDLNMVRAGAVGHPKDWVWGGYQEIQGKRCRKRVIDLKTLKDVFDMDSVENLRKAHAEWIQAALDGSEMGRNEIWTKGVAVGNEDFVRRTQQWIGIRVNKRKVAEKDGAFMLREPMRDYGLYSGPENSPIVLENRYIWDVI